MQSHYLAESYIPVQGHIPMKLLSLEMPAGVLHPDGAYLFPRKYGGVDQWAPPYRLKVSRAFIPFIFSLCYINSTHSRTWKTLRQVSLWLTLKMMQTRLDVLRPAVAPVWYAIYFFLRVISVMTATRIHCSLFIGSLCSRTRHSCWCG